MAKKSYGLKLAFTLFVLALCMVAVWYGSLSMMLWTPPEPSQMTHAAGRFEPHPWRTYDCGRWMCPGKPYVFVTQSGERLELNCEPGPALNRCLDGNAKQEYIRNVEDGEWQISYFRDAYSSGRQDHLVVSEARVNGDVVIRHDDTIARIRNSTVTPAGANRGLAAVVQGPPPPVRVEGSPVNRVLAWIFIGCLGLATLNLVVRIFGKLFRM